MENLNDEIQQRFDIITDWLEQYRDIYREVILNLTDLLIELKEVRRIIAGRDTFEQRIMDLEAYTEQLKNRHPNAPSLIEYMKALFK